MSMAEIKITRFDNHPSGALGRVEYTGHPRWGFVVDKNHAPHFWFASYTDDGKTNVGTTFLHEIVGRDGLDSLPSAVVGSTIGGYMEDGSLVLTPEGAVEPSAEAAAYETWSEIHQKVADESFNGECPHSLI